MVKGRVRITGVNVADEGTLKATRPQQRTVYIEEALALASASSLLSQDRGLEDTMEERTGIVLGVDSVIDEWKEGFFKGVMESGPLGASPLCFPYTSPNALAARLSIAFGLKGVEITIASGPLSFLKAMAYSYELVAGGRMERVLAGGITRGRVIMTVLDRKCGDDFICGAFESKGPGAGIRSVASMDETFSIFVTALDRLHASGSEHPLCIGSSDQWGNRVDLYVGNERALETRRAAIV